MTYLIGLTGSIGMGKSTTAKIFAEEGCAVWDADAAVHRLYSAGGAAVAPMQDAFPDAVIDGTVSRDALKAAIAADPTALRQIEQIVHPLVAEDRQAFIAKSDADIVVLDIPLLFEGSGHRMVNTTVVVSVPEDVQRDRVLARGTMTEDQFMMIKSKQMPDAEKRALADHVVITDTLDHARDQVRAIVAKIRKELADA
ncbi:dephospho-CoA kinase [Pseudooceanicola nitratireducens]|jgi:dephospho-CoA kinase|uniref:Dephospho-CoA kinase n=1 Tax=Pseudooceanicola nitratireducens TaxID=517719 RepID=A0A1I1HG35_9RHOB|nr:dephospho-CoA kinase [Pseudooceanicola nitratireducens]SEJ09703.1 dephospho-CoA kinase [Pseudooceanicola nitratireducens]SFC20070.1 dephospho-CoA kinase [Pseudooceanicola nitratireducens]